jgi:leucyl-tRNA synthetase
MRREFEYWYPLDVRVSGKDLRILESQEVTGTLAHLLTVEEQVTVSTDTTGPVLLAGDSIEDANFEESVANSNILRLYTLKEWIEEVVNQQGQCAEPRP